MYIIPTWIPVSLAVLQALGYAAWSMLSKHLTSERIGFNALDVTFTTIYTVNCSTLLFSIYYFIHVGELNLKLYGIGLIGSFFDTLGIVCITKAFSCGPAGLIAALATSTNMLLTLIEALKH